jgi:hypothetical protein
MLTTCTFLPHDGTVVSENYLKEEKGGRLQWADDDDDDDLVARITLSAGQQMGRAKL